MVRHWWEFHEKFWQCLLVQPIKPIKSLYLCPKAKTNKRIPNAKTTPRTQVLELGVRFHDQDWDWDRTEHTINILTFLDCLPLPPLSFYPSHQYFKCPFNDFFLLIGDRKLLQLRGKKKIKSNHLLDSQINFVIYF